MRMITTKQCEAVIAYLEGVIAGYMFAHKELREKLEEARNQSRALMDAADVYVKSTIGQLAGCAESCYACPGERLTTCNLYWRRATLYDDIQEINRLCFDAAEQGAMISRDLDAVETYLAEVEETGQRTMPGWPTYHKVCALVAQLENFIKHGELGER
jgi:hypothetical protein